MCIRETWLDFPICSYARDEGRPRFSRRVCTLPRGNRGMARVTTRKMYTHQARSFYNGLQSHLCCRNYDTMRRSSLSQAGNRCHLFVNSAVNGGGKKYSGHLATRDFGRLSSVPHARAHSRNAARGVHVCTFKLAQALPLLENHPDCPSRHINESIC